MISSCLESITSCLDLALKAEHKCEHFILRLFSFFPISNLMLTRIKVSKVGIFTICLMLPQCNAYEQTT